MSLKGSPGIPPSAKSSGLPLDKTRVDASDVLNLTAGEASQKIVRSVSSLSRDLSLYGVVKGVETADQLQMLTDMGCDLIQGHIYLLPLKALDIPPSLDQQSAPRTAALG